MSVQDKRGLLKLAFGVGSAAIATTIGWPVIAAFLDPLARKAVGDARPSPYAKLGDLPVGAPRKFEVVSNQMDAWDRTEQRAVGSIWLVRAAGDRVSAYSGVCPHLGCPIGFDQDKRVFACPCHDSAYAVSDGARLKGPAARGLDPLPVEVRDGTVHVTYKKFIQGIRERKEG